jgi:hypothetical protein
MSARTFQDLGSQPTPMPTRVECGKNIYSYKIYIYVSSRACNSKKEEYVFSLLMDCKNGLLLIIKLLRWTTLSIVLDM